jgi:hypothetical protein
MSYSTTQNATNYFHRALCITSEENDVSGNTTKQSVMLCYGVSCIIESSYYSTQKKSINFD